MHLITHRNYNFIISWSIIFADNGTSLTNVNTFFGLLYNHICGAVYLCFGTLHLPEKNTFPLGNCLWLLKWMRGTVVIDRYGGTLTFCQVTMSLSCYSLFLFRWQFWAWQLQTFVSYTNMHLFALAFEVLLNSRKIKRSLSLDLESKDKER